MIKAWMLVVGMAAAAWVGSASAQEGWEPPPGTYDPWARPPGMTDPSPELTPGTLPPGFDQSGIRLFPGRSYSCMRALGGLLNCCTRNVDPQGNNERWWEIYRDRMRQGAAASTACSAEGAGQEGSHSSIGPGMSVDELQNAFTNLREQLAGGGSDQQCGNQARMADVRNDFMDYLNTEVKPRLSWYCDDDEVDLAAQKEIGACTYLGDFCSSSVLGVCIDKRQRHCCWNSPMSKMIREQLADQGIGGFGTAKNPNCNGLTLDQVQQLQTDELDTGDLEGRMLLAGVMPDLSNLLGTDWQNLLTGDGTRDSNEGRQDLLDRTLGRTGDLDWAGGREGIEGNLGGLLTRPDPTPVASFGAISFANGRVYAQRGRPLRVRVTRTGGQGVVSIAYAADGGSASSPVDYAPFGGTLSWSSGDTSERSFMLSIPDSLPRPTDERVLRIVLSNPTGGATIGATAVMEVVIRPRD